MKNDSLANRHIGINEQEEQLMLQKIGVKSLDELIDKTLPKNIRLKQPIDLPEAMNEYEFAQHIAHLASKNKLYLSPEANSDDELWNISIAEDGTTQIISVSRDTRCIQYNATSPRFACYTGNQQDVCLYRQEMTESGISAAATGADAVFSVYGMDGRLIRTAGSSHEALRGLPHGIYILNGKVIIK